MSLQAKFFAVMVTVLLLSASMTSAWCWRHPQIFSGETVALGSTLTAVALAACYIGTRSICRPLRQMSRDMERIALGKDTARQLAQAGRTDELGTAARAFNQVVDAAQWTTTALKAANDDLERRVANRTAELERNRQREITESNQAQARLATAEQKYRSIFENATEGIFQTSLDGRCISANPAMVRLLGYDSAEQIKATVTNLATQLYTDPEQRRIFLEKLTRDGKIEQFVAEVFRRDGKRIWISITARVIHSPEGETYFEGTVRDFTAQRMAEVELRHSEAEARKLAIVASRTHNPVLITDSLGKLEWANTAFTELTGYGLDEMRGKKPGTLLQGSETDPATVRLMRERIAAGQPFKVEVVNYSRTGRKYWLSIDAEPVKDPEGHVQKYIALEEDVTERKRAEWLEQDRRALLEMVARNEPLTSTLQAVCRAGERQCEQVLGAVLLFEENRRHTAAAPRLAHDVVKQIDAILATTEGPFFTASSFDQNLNNSNLAGLSEATAAAGIVSHGALPITAGNGSSLGEFVLFHLNRAASPQNDQKIMQSLAGLAGLAIEHHQLTNRLAFQAKHDHLTGLSNRAELDMQLPLWVASASREKQVMAVLMIDLDGFKHVNDTLGHAVGDALLRQVASRLLLATRGSDVLARTGGDEFTLVATELRNESDAIHVARRLVDALSVSCEIDGLELFVTSSIGIAVFPTDGPDAQALQRNADAAMYAAKAAGRNQAMRYDPLMSVAAIERMELEGQLRRALENQEMSLAYQPQVDRNGSIVGVEALLRWTNPRLGKISPARFIPVAEQSGLIVAIGTWVLYEACRRASAWNQAGCPPICVAVNVSALQFQQPEFVSLVASALADSGFDPTMLELELTESLLLTNINDVLKKLSELRSMGVGIAIDDFGTGYSSLAYLYKLPIDRLKIDQSFVREFSGETGESFSKTAVISAIVSLAASLGKGVVAEGVETASQRDYLIDIGCGTLQGFLFSPPVSPERIEQMLSARRIEAIPLAIPA